MSGSPVYIDGRLIGAVSYSIGAFSKEADRRHHADRGDEGRDARCRAAPPHEQARLELPITREGCRPALAAAYAALAPFARAPADVQAIGLPAAAGRAARRDAAADRHAAAHGRLRARRVDLVGGAFRDAGFSPVITGAGGGAPDERPTGPLREGRRDRRVARQRRPRDGRDRHRHPHRRRQRLRLRPSLLQPRPDRVPDDARLRLHDAAEPDDVVQDLQHGRDDRDDAAGSRDGDCRHARARDRRWCR